MTDDGRGGALQEGSGLNGMHERVELLGGTIETDGSRGTILRVRVSMKIRILIAEDQAMVRAASAALLETESDLSVIAQHRTAVRL